MTIDLNMLENLEKMQGGVSNENQNESAGDTTPPPTTTPPPSSENCFLDGWTTIYDKTSTDAAINLGFTSGIPGSTGTLTNLPDLTPYKLMRVQFFASDASQYFYLDITDKADNNHRLQMSNATGMTFFTISFAIATRNEKSIMNIGTCTRVVMSTSKYPTTTSYANNTSVCYIKKIDVK